MLLHYKFNSTSSSFDLYFSFNSNTIQIWTNANTTWFVSRPTRKRVGQRCGFHKPHNRHCPHPLGNYCYRHFLRSAFVQSQNEGAENYLSSKSSDTSRKFSRVSRYILHLPNNWISEKLLDKSNTRLLFQIRIVTMAIN